LNRPKIDPEKLAALLDGRMNEADRRELMSGVANSPDDLALIADVAAMNREMHSEVTNISDTRTKRRPWLVRQRGWIAIAAGIVGITTLTMLGRRDRPRPQPWPKGIDFVVWDKTRGPSEGPRPSSATARSWRVGARIADLDLAIAAHDSMRIRLFAREIRDLLEDHLLLGAQTYFARVADSAGADSRTLARLTRDARQLLGAPLDSHAGRLGEWVESARVAALRGDSAFFTTAESRRAAADLVSLDAPGARELAAEINAANLAPLKDRLAALLETMGR
jgi:hypothetical protein